MEDSVFEEILSHNPHLKMFYDELDIEAKKEFREDVYKAFQAESKKARRAYIIVQALEIVMIFVMLLSCLNVASSLYKGNMLGFIVNSIIICINNLSYQNINEARKIRYELYKHLISCKKSGTAI